jgi:hypothetical protein
MESRVGERGEVVDLVLFPVFKTLTEYQFISLRKASKI